VSDIFPLPDWQLNANVTKSANPGGRIGRGVPDVAGNADPRTGYILLYQGETVVLGGTSAVAPLWAGLIALVNQDTGRRAGFLNPTIYRLKSDSGALNDITSGNNGAYKACPGWDACTGLGTPDGANLLRALDATA